MAEFWPRDRRTAERPWLVPHPSLLRRLWCRLTGGHDWQTHYWSGAQNETCPAHDYCVKCWRFRERGRWVGQQEMYR